MHLKSLAPTVLLSLGLVAAAVFAANDKKSPPAAKSDDNYPLKTCVVSGEQLGGPGDYFTYIHKEAGKPDRVVRFCCDGCVDDFKKDPAMYLKKIDDAAAGKKAPADAPAKEKKH